MARTEGPLNSATPTGMPAGIPGVSAVDQQRSAENFPVALRILPRRIRADLVAIYGFARLVDDIGDEYEGDRSAALDWLEGDLRNAFIGRATHPLLVRLMPTIRRRKLSLQPFLDLINANRRDQAQTRYATFADLLEYCALSANPVGRLVLATFGVDDPALVRLSNDVCSGLQLIEHLQDVGEDWRGGRIYLPQEDLFAFNCSEEDLGAPSASDDVRSLLAFEAARCHELLRSGRPLVRGLHGWARLAIAGFVAGGEATLDSIQQEGVDVLAVQCRPRRGRVVEHAMSLLFGKPR